MSLVIFSLSCKLLFFFFYSSYSSIILSRYFCEYSWEINIPLFYLFLNPIVIYKANLTSIIYNMQVHVILICYYQWDHIIFSSNKKIILIQFKFTTVYLSTNYIYSPSFHFYNAHFFKIYRLKIIHQIYLVQYISTIKNLCPVLSLLLRWRSWSFPSFINGPEPDATRSKYSHWNSNHLGLQTGCLIRGAMVDRRGEY